MENDRNDGHIIMLQGPIEPGFDIRRAVMEILNHTLANEALLSFKTRSAHWNVSGPGFLELHMLYKIQYKQLNTIADEIAERACTLGGLATGSFKGFLNNARLEDQPGVIPNIMNLLAGHEASIQFLGEDAKMCSELYADESTGDFLINIQQMHQQMAGILRTHVAPRPLATKQI